MSGLFYSRLGSLLLSTSALLFSRQFVSGFSRRSMSSNSIPIINSKSISYIGSSLARQIDESLMASPGFSIDQLMELAGLTVAQASHDFMSSYNKSISSQKILVLCGPGNNGGDGLVAARHLSHFGYRPTVVYPKRSSGVLFGNLVKQLDDLHVPILSDISDEEYRTYSMTIDAIFGFSFKGQPREPFASQISLMKRNIMDIKVISIDIPSGWNVDDENQASVHDFVPSAVVSLTLPKYCLKYFHGIHYLGGRFVPPNVGEQYQIQLPNYGFGSHLFARIEDSECEMDPKDIVASNSPNPLLSVLFSTASSKDEAMKISNALVSSHLVACVNMIPSITSVYEWQGKLETSEEYLLILKVRDSSKLNA